MRRLIAASTAALLGGTGCASADLADVVSGSQALAPALASAVAEDVALDEVAELAQSALDISNVPTNGWTVLGIDGVAYSDVHRLDAADAAFRAHVEDAMEGAGTEGCTLLEVSVMAHHPDGYLLGSMSTDCGGGPALWAETDGEWKLELGLVEPPACTELLSLIHI